jgi:hypothetical protein
MRKHTINSRVAVGALVRIHKSNKPDGEKGVCSDDEFEYTVQDGANSLQ